MCRYKKAGHGNSPVASFVRSCFSTLVLPGALRPTAHGSRTDLAAAHAVATVVTEIAVAVANGDRSAVVTRRSVDLETSKLLLLGRRGGFNLRVPVTMAASVTGCRILQACQERGSLDNRHGRSGVFFQLLRDAIRGCCHGAIAIVGFVTHFATDG